jgi:hypothetical protein
MAKYKRRKPGNLKKHKAATQKKMKCGHGVNLKPCSVKLQRIDSVVTGVIDDSVAARVKQGHCSKDLGTLENSTSESEKDSKEGKKKKKKKDGGRMPKSFPKKRVPIQVKREKEKLTQRSELEAKKPSKKSHLKLKSKDVTEKKRDAKKLLPVRLCPPKKLKEEFISEKVGSSYHFISLLHSL